MSEPTPPKPAQPYDDRERVDWGRRLLYGAIGVVVLLVLSLMASAIVPRWWGQRIADQVNGSLVAGIGLGTLYGLVFTILPLLMLWVTFRRRRPVKIWIGGVVIALILALPNLMTLGIVVGRGNAAHAAERTLDVEAPFFRGFTALGAIAAALLFAAWRYQMLTRRHARRRVGDLEAELDLRKKSDEARESAAE
ncbi:MAG: permease [Actinobacteria bacterium]|nr:permease [Thermoleophilia bacterium]MCB9010764.1 permease [Actinomycetota bacterium]